MLHQQLALISFRVTLKMSRLLLLLTVSLFSSCSIGICDAGKAPDKMIHNPENVCIPIKQVFSTNRKDYFYKNPILLHKSRSSYISRDLLNRFDAALKELRESNRIYPDKPQSYEISDLGQVDLLTGTYPLSQGAIDNLSIEAITVDSKSVTATVEFSAGKADYTQKVFLVCEQGEWKISDVQYTQVIKAGLIEIDSLRHALNVYLKTKP